MIKHVDRGSTRWHFAKQFRRVHLSLSVYRHTYPTATDRWVFTPRVIYDRKRKPLEFKNLVSFEDGELL